MSKCIETSKAQAAREQRQGATQETPVPFSDVETEKLLESAERIVRNQKYERGEYEPPFESSPLLQVLRSHFDRYAGLTEPKIDTLRPQTDDL
jgi:hypothetical protein